MRMCLATVALKVIMSGGQGGNSNFSRKSTLIYGRLLDIVFKVDHIDSEDDGKQYLNI